MRIKEISSCDLCGERHEDLNPFHNGSAIVGVSTGHGKWLILFELTFLRSSHELKRLIRMYKNNILLLGF